MAKKEDLIEVKIREIGEKEVADFLKNLRPNIRSRLDAALASLLGISTQWGRVEIDHCNGRNSVLVDAVREIALKEVRGIISQKGKINSFTPLIEKCLESEIKSQIAWFVKKEVEEQIKPVIEQMVAERLPGKVREAIQIVLTAKGKQNEKDEMPF